MVQCRSFGKFHTHFKVFEFTKLAILSLCNSRGLLHRYQLLISVKWQEIQSPKPIIFPTGNVKKYDEKYNLDIIPKRLYIVHCKYILSTCILE